jgi:hypothetical protein
MKLRRIWVDGLPSEWASPFGEFMLFHGVTGASVIDHPDKRKLEVVFTYAGEVAQ